MTLQISDIEMVERGRSSYDGIDELAESIEQNGLIQPIVLVSTTNPPKHRLVAGGRRLTALKQLGVTELHHGVSSQPGCYGYVLKSEVEEQDCDLARLLVEIAENLDRHDLDWRDEAKLIAKAWKLSKRQADLKSETLLMRDFGAMLGCGYAHLQAAVSIYDTLTASPDIFANDTSWRMAYHTKLKLEANEISKLANKNIIEPKVKVQPSVDDEFPSDEVHDEPELVVNLTDNFKHMSGLDYLSTVPVGSIDHVITDPDYGVSVDRLNSNMAGAAEGVAQSSVEQTLNELRMFLSLSFHALNDHGFLIFFYDLDHHEKLQAMATSVGFRVQRWPLIWEKVGFQSNAAPSHNFCKNMEYAMVCRKPGATLAEVRTSSIYRCAGDGVVKQLGHPFAKPYALWSWLYSAVATPGQVVFDPFVGSGSSAIAALELGLRPIGCELQEVHYNSLLVNLQTYYQKANAGSVVSFI